MKLYCFVAAAFLAFFSKLVITVYTKLATTTLLGNVRAPVKIRIWSNKCYSSIPLYKVSKLVECVNIILNIGYKKGGNRGDRA